MRDIGESRWAAVRFLLPPRKCVAEVVRIGAEATSSRAQGCAGVGVRFFAGPAPRSCWRYYQHLVGDIPRRTRCRGDGMAKLERVAQMIEQAQHSSGSRCSSISCSSPSSTPASG